MIISREGQCNVRSDKYYTSERGLTMDVCYFYRDGTEMGKDRTDPVGAEPGRRR